MPSKLHRADSLREVLFHLHAHDDEFVFTGRSLKELNQNLAQMVGEGDCRDIVSRILDIDDFVIDRRRWFSEAIDEKHFTWIERDPLGGMFTLFYFLSGHLPDIDKGTDYNDYRNERWISFDELRLGAAESADERLLSIQNMFDLSDFSLNNKVLAISEINGLWREINVSLRKEFSFILSKKDFSEQFINDLWDCAIENGFPDFGYCAQTPDSRMLALPCMYYFWEKNDKKHILNTLKTRSYRLNYSRSIKEKKTITAKIDQSTKEKLDRILLSRGVNIHSLLTHWIEKTYDTLKK